APEVSYSDVISVSFGRLEIPSEPLPNPASAPKVSFAVASSSVSESVAGGKAKITIKLDKASVRTVTTEVQVKTSPGAQPRCCIDITNENQDKVSVNRFDWDYEIKSLSATFLPGETSKDIEIIIATDDRDEGDSEVLNLELSQNGTTVAIIDDQKKSHALTIVDDDEPYTGAALTLTQLLRPGGILYVNCLGCHNSVDNEGGYDITDYHGLIENNVLIPYDVNSKAFARMNSETPGLPPMPFTGLLETAKRRAVQDWIMSGAKNN
ncbi:MAG: hypothetical protein KDD35_09910, partial [Bdellovibrionales bacterium]|nr:hypothetical protein [Bdellovibrionales bacterium]